MRNNLYKYEIERKKIINELEYIRCQSCGANKSFKFHCHHIVFRSEKPNHDNLHNPKNLIIVCDECHAHFHSKKSYRNNLIRARKLNELFNDEYLIK